MRSGIHGTFATLLLMVPVLSIPALAIFGIPQFAPVVASPLDEGANSDRERRVGQSARSGQERFPGDLEDAPAFDGDPIDRRSDSAPGRIGDSVSLSRPGRQNTDRSGPGSGPDRFGSDRSGSNGPASFGSGDARNRGAGANQDRRWMEDSMFDDSRRPSGFGDAQNFNDGRPMNDSGDSRFDQRPSANGLPQPKQSQPPMTNRNAGNGNSPDGPRVFQRPRNPNAENNESRAAVPESEALTWQAAVRKLNDLEIRNFRLQPGHRENQFAFICSYTPKDSPRVSYRFEAEADEPLKAVEKVFEQIAEWQQRRQ
jgi:hypothetical protein